MVEFSKAAGRKGDQADKHEKQSVDIGQHRVHIFCVDENKEMVRPPVGEKEEKTQNITQKYRQQALNFQPETHVVYRLPDQGRLDFKNENRHHDGKNAVGKL